MEIRNPGPVLMDLQSSILGFNGSMGQYLTRNPAQSAGPGLDGVQNFNVPVSVLPVALSELGIRSMLLDSAFDPGPLQQLDEKHGLRIALALPEHPAHGLVRKEMLALFGKCRTVCFDDWSLVSGASKLWNLLLVEVFSALESAQREVIFYLGETSEFQSSQVEEALQVMAAFASFGAVTLALNEQEAMRLWMLINGFGQSDVEQLQSPGTSGKRYFSIFRTVGVSQLLIYSSNQARLFSDQEQFVFYRKLVDESLELGKDARQHFIAGLAMGIQMNLSWTHCIALGLVVFGSSGVYSQHNSLVQEYIRDWLSDLQRPEHMYLYQ